MIVEVCVESGVDAAVAAAAKAERVEVCSALAVGGVTPSFGTMEAVRERFSGGVVVLVRPRPGDFCYRDDDVATMVADIRAARRAGADGVAIGALAPDGTIDLEATRRLINAAESLVVTFHRAFDWTVDPHGALEALVDLGVRRILTSGQARTAHQGIPLLRDLVRRAGERITILPGGGLRPENVAEVATATGAKELHFSARGSVRSAWAGGPPKVSFAGSPPPDDEIAPTHPAILAAMLRALGRAP